MSYVNTIVVLGICFSYSMIVGNETYLEKERNVTFEPLTISIRSDKCAVFTNEDVYVTVELRNDSKNDQVIYMPGIHGNVIFTQRGNNPVRPDEFGIPIGFGRSKSKNVEDDFVTLKPGDIYGRRYSIVQKSPCDMKFSFFYENKNIKKNSWTGKSASVKIDVKVRSNNKDNKKDSDKGAPENVNAKTNERIGQTRLQP
jgi:hypothetical protein